jgi:Asp-tRNA(Asn)/Glu-tRNA(Gln) amidotransferase A subunit family amidase
MPPTLLAGLPAVSLPAGLGRDSGLPVGVQLVAGYGGEVDLLHFASVGLYTLTHSLKDAWFQPLSL